MKRGGEMRGDGGGGEMKRGRRVGADYYKLYIVHLCVHLHWDCQTQF